METITSVEVLKLIRDSKIKLPKKVRDGVEKIIYDAIVHSYAAGKKVANGACDCGQMSCPECHG